MIQGEGGRAMRYVLDRTVLETRNPVLEATSNAIIITDRDARIEWTNPAFTELTATVFRKHWDGSLVIY